MIRWVPEVASSPEGRACGRRVIVEMIGARVCGQKDITRIDAKKWMLRP